jgi:hypothetical protein
MRGGARPKLKQALIATGAIATAGIATAGIKDFIQKKREYTQEYNKLKTKSESDVSLTYRLALYYGFFDLLTVVEKLLHLIINKSKYVYAIPSYCTILQKYTESDFLNTILQMSNRNETEISAQPPTDVNCLHPGFPHLEKVFKIKTTHPAYQPIYDEEIAFLKANPNFKNALSEIQLDNATKLLYFSKMIDQHFIKFPSCTNQANNGAFTLKAKILTEFERLKNASNVSEDDLYNLYVQFLELNFWCYYTLQIGNTIEGDINAQLTNTLSDNQKTVIKLIRAMYLKQ